MPLLSRVVSWLALWLIATPTIAQSNLGELLDAGATKLSAEEFSREVVQHTIFGPTATGGQIEVMYANNGSVQGLGTIGAAWGTSVTAPINGQWTFGDKGTVCTTMQIAGGVNAGVGGSSASIVLPRRCQFWFKYGGQYFLSDSDSDRRARVLQRTAKL